MIKADRGRSRGSGEAGGRSAAATCFAGVTPNDLATTRQRLGLTTESLAAELNLTPAVIAAWESGRIKPSRRAEQWLTWRAAMLDRDESLAASGLPECADLRALHAGTAGAVESPDARRKRMDAVLAHLQRCPTCLARRHHIEERFPPMPQPPMAASMRFVVWAFNAVGRLRGWLRRVWLR